MKKSFFSSLYFYIEIWIGPSSFRLLMLFGFSEISIRFNEFVSKCFYYVPYPFRMLDSYVVKLLRHFHHKEVILCVFHFFS